MTIERFLFKTKTRHFPIRHKFIIDEFCSTPQQLAMQCIRCSNYIFVNRWVFRCVVTGSTIWNEHPSTVLNKPCLVITTDEYFYDRP